MAGTAVAPFKDEAAFQAEVMRACLTFGLLAYHPYRSDRSVKGFPDTVIVGAKGVLYRELKMPKGVVSPEQANWIEALTIAGQNAGVWRPEHWPGLITAELQALGRLRVSARPSMSQAQARAHLQRRGFVTD